MKITQNTRERLVIKDFPWAFGLFFLLLGGSVFYLGARGLIYNKGADKAVGICAFVSLLFLLSAAAITKRSVFIFDLELQTLTWSRLGVFGWKGGTIAFGRITGCIVQVMQMDRKAPTYRLVLASPDGDIPLTDTYNTSSLAAREKMREAIHTALGLPAPEPELTPDIDKQIQALISHGQIIAAIKLVRERRGCSLAEAKDLVDAQKGNQIG